MRADNHEARSAVDKFKKGDEVWWFVVKHQHNVSNNLWPDSLDLVHDIVEEDSDGPYVKCSFGFRPDESIWGKSRQEAWDRLKTHVEQWGKLE